MNKDELKDLEKLFNKYAIAIEHRKFYVLKEFKKSILFYDKKNYERDSKNNKKEKKKGNPIVKVRLKDYVAFIYFDKNSNSFKYNDGFSNNPVLSNLICLENVNKKYIILNRKRKLKNINL